MTERKTDDETPHKAEHYAALGLHSDASLADIKKAFRQKASQFHPDRNTASDAPARFREVQQAYDVLSDANKRQAYDDNRRRNLLDDPAQTAREIWTAYFAPLRAQGH
jgi:DnaJ-class molecular chaperone